MARATSTRLKNRFGKRFLLVFPCWQRYRILEMAFARSTALGFLRRAYEQNRLAHAYLITGAPGSGKEVLAAELTSLVNGTPTKDVFSAKAREVFIARPESKSRRIITAQIRALEHALQMRAKWAAQGGDRCRRRSASNRGGKRVSQDIGRTAKGFAVASAKRIARGSPGNSSFAVHRYSTGVRRQGSEQERGRETREIAATNFPPYVL